MIQSPYPEGRVTKESLPRWYQARSSTLAEYQSLVARRTLLAVRFSRVHREVLNCVWESPRTLSQEEHSVLSLRLGWGLFRVEGPPRAYVPAGGAPEPFPPPRSLSPPSIQAPPRLITQAHASAIPGPLCPPCQAENPARTRQARSWH